MNFDPNVRPGGYANMMTPPPTWPPGPGHPPNAFLPPTSLPIGAYPRFSGPMHGQPVFSQSQLPPQLAAPPHSATNVKHQQLPTSQFPAISNLQSQPAGLINAQPQFPIQNNTRPPFVATSQPSQSVASSINHSDLHFTPNVQQPLNAHLQFPPNGIPSQPPSNTLPPTFPTNTMFSPPPLSNTTHIPFSPNTLSPLPENKTINPAFHSVTNGVASQSPMNNVASAQFPFGNSTIPLQSVPGNNILPRFSTTTSSSQAQFPISNNMPSQNPNNVIVRPPFPPQNMLTQPLLTSISSQTPPHNMPPPFSSNPFTPFQTPPNVSSGLQFPPNTLPQFPPINSRPQCPPTNIVPPQCPPPNIVRPQCPPTNTVPPQCPPPNIVRPQCPPTNIVPSQCPPTNTPSQSPVPPRFSTAINKHSQPRPNFPTQPNNGNKMFQGNLTQPPNPSGGTNMTPSGFQRGGHNPQQTRPLMWGTSVNNNTPRGPPRHRSPGFVPDDIFIDAPTETIGSFPHFNPNQPPPPLPSLAMNSNRGGPGSGRGPPTRGFHGRGQSFGLQRGRGQRGEFHRGGSRGRGQFQGGRGNASNNNNNNNTNFQKKKEKFDKRDLPENNVFFCDICDRGFKTQEKYKEHVDGHQKCAFKDCPFVAAPKLVQLHMTMQHRGNLAKRVWSVATEEDIKKWKEDRKKNYPTAENTKRKIAEREEKIARGEVIETEEFSKMSGGRDGNRERGRGRGRNRRGRRNGRDDSDKGKDSAVVVEDDDDAPPEEVKIKRSSEPHNLDAGSLDSDLDVCVATPSSDKTKPKDTGQPKTAALATDKNGSAAIVVSDDDDGAKSDDSHKENAPVSAVTGNGANSSKHDRDGALKESSTLAPPSLPSTHPDKDAIQGHGSEAAKSPSEQEAARGKKRGQASGQSEGQGPLNKKSKGNLPKAAQKSYTLLQKLLSKEIRRERNKILQCVHFIVKNKFFECEEGS